MRNVGEKDEKQCWKYSIKCIFFLLVPYILSVWFLLHVSPGPGCFKAHNTDTQQNEITANDIMTTELITGSGKIIVVSWYKACPIDMNQTATTAAILYFNVTGWSTAKYCSIHRQICIRGLPIQDKHRKK